MTATKIKLNENLLKIILQTYFWCTKRCNKGLKWAGAKISILEILSDYFCCQLIAPLFVQYFISSSRICFVSIATLLPHFEFCSLWFILLKMVYSLKDPGIRSTLLIMRVYFKMQKISAKRTVLLLFTEHTALTILGSFICYEQ